MISILKNYPGANIEFIHYEVITKTVYLRQELRDTEQWWFYWNFCAVSLEGGKFRFKFCNNEVVGKYGPAIKEENEEWHYRDDTFVNHTTFEYTLKPGVKTYFCFSIPYQLSDFEKFSNSINLKPRFLTLTRKGRMLNYYLMGNLESKEVIIFTSRHHACESIASYILEGILKELSENHQSKLLQYKIVIIPFVDLDGVEDGDQGKSRLPHDHNRDYGETPIYAYTRALYRLLENDKIICGIDLHCPYKWGGIHDKPSIIEGPTPHCENQHIFSDILEKDTEDNPIKYYRRDNLKHGEHWNVGSPNNAVKYFIDKGAKLAFSLEMPYFGYRDTPYTQDELRIFGHSMLNSLEKFFLNVIL